MGKALCLQSIMKDVSANIVPAAPSVLTELQAFLVIDPLLARLHKEYLDAKDTRCKSEKDFGKGDAMTDMALLVEDSAWCAMQTRYMEVRADRALMSQAQSLMDDERAKDKKQREQEKTADALRFYNYMEMLMRIRKREVSSINWLWALIFLFDHKAFNFRTYQPTHQFNRLAA
jgi:hypothetical protein